MTIDVTAWLLLLLFWAATALNLAAAWRCNDRFHRLQFLAMSAAAFAGAVFYTHVAASRPVPVLDIVLQTQRLSRMVWGTVALIHCLIPWAWLVRYGKDGCNA